ncbi:hypothetical protein LA080_001785 [Diaporthe eres]|nr:hypothetical protein LA080_001785 [Diaporthe eres]
MPTIPEDSVMEDFVNWDKAEPALGLADTAPRSGTNLDFQPVRENQDFDLALANIDGDDFSFWALEHFETSNLAPSHAPAGPLPPHSSNVAALDLCEFSDDPCDACEASGFACKRLEEGEYKGYCTTCVALKNNCSFGLAPSVASTTEPFPSNPWPIAGQQASLVREDGNTLRSSSSPDLETLVAVTESQLDNGHKSPVTPKIGARFSRESVRILKAWLSTHSTRPYPTDEERETLQRQTGLNKTQIANWLANARRRSKGKFQPTRSTSPSVRGYSGAIEIPRRATPSAEHMNPLQRWQNSPPGNNHALIPPAVNCRLLSPENEPASVTAIASAILNNSHSSGLDSPNSMSLNYNLTDDDADRSCKGSSASSFGTSPSSASLVSGFSHHSRGSFGSFGSIQHRGRRRRRRRTAPKQGDEKSGLNAPLKTFQCTFCTERQLDERTFYRKDHLRQHLKLVHNTKYLNWSMDSWKVATPDIKSRCGFCRLALASWGVRVDHLAEHFKTGSDMKDWKGDWGFENAVLSNVENAMPPWLIHQERQTPLPFQASQQSPESPRSAYELIKIELAYYLRNTRDAMGAIPSDEEMQHEACRIIYASEPLSHSSQASDASWLRDLLLSSNEIRHRAQLSRLRGPAENCLGRLQINGQENIFENCPMETQLNDFVKARTLLGLTTTDYELQVEACNIVGRMEEKSIIPSEEVANFMLRLIYGDSSWMSDFRQRAGLPVPNGTLDLKDQSAANSTIYNYSQLEVELAEFTRNQRALGTSPTDDELRSHARCVVHKCSKSQNETAADNRAWLDAFKQRHLRTEPGQASPSNSNSPSHTLEPLIQGLNTDRASASGSGFPPFTGSGTNSPANAHCPEYSPMCGVKRAQLFLNGSGNYRPLVRELARFVASAMSPNNPNRHIPTDEEIRHQARWVLYDDDDLFNVTPADSAEWLIRFKRSTGILPITEGPGLPDDLGIGAVGSGLRTRLQGPHSASASPKPTILAHAPFTGQNATVSSSLGADFNMINSHSYGNSSMSVSSNPGAVFNSQDFEDKLMQFAVAEVATSGRMPADEALIARAKEILGFEVWQAETTPADDPELLGRFKVLVVDRVRTVLGDPGDSSHSNKNSSPMMPTISSPPPATHHSERGMDAIDPGLLPDLPPVGADAKKNSVSPLPGDVQVAISEARLEEILREI